MTELLIVMVAALAVIAGATVVGPRLGIASPLVLVAIGVGASFLPVFAGAHVEPEWILQGVLPPLLYSSAVSMPAMNFRREFGAISGLSVLLVVGSSLLLGLFFLLVIPDLGFAWGVALGAIVSPLLRRITPPVDQAAADAQTEAEVTRIVELLRSSAETIPEPPPAGFETARTHRLAVIEAQRAALLDARDNGTFDADVLAKALADLDASQLALEIRTTLAV